MKNDFAEMINNHKKSEEKRSKNKKYLLKKIFGEMSSNQQIL